MVNCPVTLVAPFASTKIPDPGKRLITIPRISVSSPRENGRRTTNPLARELSGLGPAPVPFNSINGGPSYPGPPSDQPSSVTGPVIEGNWLVILMVFMPREPGILNGTFTLNSN